MVSKGDDVATISDVDVEHTERLPDAAEANAQEHELTFWQGIKLYPKAVFWSLAMSTVIIMEGFDNKLLSTLYALPVFREQFGHMNSHKKYEISAPWQSGLGNGASIGQLAGLLIGGHLIERYGFRKMMLAGQTAIVGCIFIQFFAKSLPVLLVAQIVFGIPLGIFQASAVVYALELGPLCLRAYLTNYIHLCWALGQLLAVGSVRGLLKRGDEWSYRIPFAMQWMWPTLLIPLTYFAPESPWWHARRGQPAQAKANLKRLVSPKNTEFDFDKHVALMVLTTRHELEIESGTSYRTCFQGTNLRRTIIVMMIYCVQTLNGNPLRGFSTYFFQKAGLQTTQSFNMSIIQFAVAILGGITSWPLLPLAGRRTLYMTGLFLLLTIMASIGALGIPQAHNPKSDLSWGIGSLLVISSFIYYASVGPLTNTICVEIPSAMLRSKSIALARGAYIITTIIAGVLTPYQLNEDAWNWGAKTAFFWLGGCIISFTFSYFCLPETKDRTTAETDYLFEKKVSARNFAKTPVNFEAAITGVEGKDVQV